MKTCGMTIFIFLVILGCSKDKTTSGTAPKKQQASAVAATSDIAAYLPQGLALYYEGKELPALLTGLDQLNAPQIAGLPAGATLGGELAKPLSKYLGLTRAQVQAAMAAIGTIAIGMTAKNAPKPQFGAAITFTNPSVVKPLLGAKMLQAKGPTPGNGKLYEVKTPREKFALAWFPRNNFVVLGTPGFVTSVGTVVAGKAKALSTDPRYRKAIAKFHAKRQLNGFTYVDALGSDPSVPFFAAMAKGEPIVFSLGLIPKKGTRMTINLPLNPGGGLPARGVLAAPATVTLYQRLPSDLLAAMGLSTKLAAKPAQLAKLMPPDMHEDFSKLFATPLADVFATLGDEAVLGVALQESKGKPTLNDLSQMALIGLFKVRDKAKAKHLLDQAQAKLGKKYKPAVQIKDGFDITTPNGPQLTVVLRLKEDVVFGALGNAQSITKAYNAFAGKGPKLADNKQFKTLQSSLPQNPHALVWTNVAKLATLSTMSADASMIPLGSIQQMLKGQDISMGMSARFDVKGGIWHLQLDSLNGIGVYAATAIYGVRRYLASSKTSEAKYAIGAISRGAINAYEINGKLCKSAQPVPQAGPPSGRKYQPNLVAGQDFQTGDEKSGWKCLKFAMTQPHYYQYFYNAGGNYLGPKHGAVDPGPNGFEAAAIGDLDGDGKTSVFILSGKVDPQTKRVKLLTDIIMVNQFE